MEPLLHKISEIYGFKVDFLEKITQGFLSENYVLTDGAVKYFLKKYRFTNAGRIEEIHRVKKYFSEGGIPVIMPLPTKTGERFFEFENRFYAIFPFVTDRQLEKEQITQKAITSLAETLAQMHLLGRGVKIPVNDFFKGWNKESSLKEIENILIKISDVKEKTLFDVLAKRNVLLKRKIIGSNSQTYNQFNFQNDHLIHGDYTIGNVFFDKDDNVSFVFDFEKTEYAPRFFELFRSMIYSTFFDEEISQDALGRAKLYIDSYRAVYQMPDDEFIAGFTAYYLRATHSVWVESEHYLKGNNRVDQLLKSDALRISYISENFEKMKEYLSR
jgi:Ser/Thr protein kinase RdoA (MazF antagonist)